jgi:hypothetical protein
MPPIYLHYFGNESSESLLEAHGITTKDQQVNPLMYKQCTNCNEPNKPDAKFCAKCRMVLTFDAYNETLESQKKREDDITELKNQVNQLRAEVELALRGGIKLAPGAKGTENYIMYEEDGNKILRKNPMSTDEVLIRFLGLDRVRS